MYEEPQSAFGLGSDRIFGKTSNLEMAVVAPAVEFPYRGEVIWLTADQGGRQPNRAPILARRVALPLLMGVSAECPVLSASGLLR